jgi:hypothetical protein
MLFNYGREFREWISVSNYKGEPKTTRWLSLIFPLSHCYSDDRLWLIIRTVDAGLLLLVSLGVPKVWLPAALPINFFRCQPRPYFQNLRIQLF